MANTQATHASRRILLPVRNGFIVFTFLAAMVANLIPFGRLPGIPDWVALTLAFWCIHQPLKVGMATAFVLGLAMDVADASVMGQHSLAYVLLAYAATGLSRRILWFPLSQQALHIWPLFFVMQLVMMIARMIGGADFPGILWFLSSMSSAFLWHPVTYLLLTPQFQSADKDVHRPI